jgi:hypothetical protein
VVEVSLHRFLRQFHGLFAHMADNGGVTASLSI